MLNIQQKNFETNRNMTRALNPNNLKMNLQYNNLLTTLQLKYIQRISTANNVIKRMCIQATSPPTLTNPDGLPHYPVPKLENTLQKYLRSIQPLLSTEEFNRNIQIVNEFGSVNGPGTRLHNLLLSKARSSENWLSEYWIKVAYLTYRIPAVVNSNPGLFFPTRTFKTNEEWLQYAAKIIVSSLQYKNTVDRNLIRKEYAGKFPLDMGQYKKIFGTCRIPGKDIDLIEYHSKSNYIIVVYKNKFFKVSVYGNDEEFLSENSILDQLFFIVNNCECKYTPVGILTTEHRDTLAEAYGRLIKDPINKNSVNTIEKSLFIVCLDEPITFTQNTIDEMNVASHQLIHGGGSLSNSGNRWFDKTLQFIINRNGLNGLNYEHSPAEGQPIAILTDFILKSLSSDRKTSTAGVNSTSIKPEELKFNLSNETLKDIHVAADNIDKLSQNLHMQILHFKNFGKDFIKLQKLSPDSFVQMAMQYAFYRLHGEPGAHYETAQLRMFIHGRTETIRSCSSESLAFAKGMCSNISDEEKVKLLKAAIKSHKDYTVMAMSGEGVDRHLLGLKLMALDGGIKIPEFFGSDGFTKSTHWRISTSQVGSTNKIFMCFGPVVEDGYGICYNPRENDIIMSVSSFKSCNSTNSETMSKYLGEAFEQMYKILCNAGEKPKSKM